MQTASQDFSPFQSIITAAFPHRSHINIDNAEPELKTAVLAVIEGLDKGELRVAEKIDGKWQVNEWIKKAVLLYFCIKTSEVVPAEFSNFFDKLPPKYKTYGNAQFQEAGTRVVPPAYARYGAYIGQNTVLMPSFVNIGAYVDSGVMVDTWATVGSCAQIGKNVHLSGGVGIGGVLEPLQASPTIIEDDCFIGARSEIVEGVIVETGSVISMGVYIGQSTKIYHRETGEITYGTIPAGSVVVPGTLPSADGRYSLYCAVIVKQVDLKTRSKTHINELLRQF